MSLMLPTHPSGMEILGKPADVMQENREERRRQQRLSAWHMARAIMNGTAYPCEVRNYCQSGLYLAYPGSLAGNEPRLGRDATVALEFDVGADGQKFRVHGRIMHASPSGFGIRLAEFPAELTRLLVASTVLPASVTDSSCSMDKRAIQQQCHALLHAYLAELAGDFFAQLPEALEEASYMSSWLEQSRYAAVAAAMEQQREVLQGAFIAAMEERIALGACAVATDWSALSSADLSLVDDGDFQDWLSLTSVSAPIEADFSYHLAEFERRYNLLLDTPLSRAGNPYAPPLIFEALRESLKSQRMADSIRAAVYRAFGRVMRRSYPAFFERLSAVLAPMKPEFSRPRIRPLGSTVAEPEEAAGGAKLADAPGSGPVSQARLDELLESLGQLLRQPTGGGGGSAMSAPTGGMPVAPVPSSVSIGNGGNAGMSSILAGASAMPSPPVLPVGAGASATLSPSTEPVGTAPGLSAVASPATLVPVHDAAVGAVPATVPAGGSAVVFGGEPACPGQPVRRQASVRELVLAIDSLAQGQLTAPPADGHVAAAQQLTARLAETGVASEIAPEHQHVIDTAATLFGKARAEHAATSEIEDLLKALEKPLLKLALRDPEFLTLVDHPARQVVNLIDRCAIAADDAGRFFDPRLRDYLSGLIASIEQRVEQEPGIFESVRGRLEQVSRQIQKSRRDRVFRLQEGCQAKEAAARVSERIDELLEGRFAGRSVPGSLLQIVENGWRQYLVLAQMLGEDGIAARDRSLTLLDRLLALLDAGASSATTRHGGTGHVIAAVCDELESQLSETCIDPDQSRPGLAALRADMRALADGQAGGVEMLPVAVGKFLSTTVEGEARLVGKTPTGVGAWFQFKEAERETPMQLVWQGRHSGRHVFTNRSATKKVELAGGEFAGWLEDGRARPHPDLALPLMERSEYALFDEAHQLLILRVLHDPVTGLLNRKGFMQRLERFQSSTSPERAHLLGLIEFDQSRVIHGRCGLAAGEQLLRELAGRLKALIGPRDLLAAFSTDTFALFLPERDGESGRCIADAILEQLGDYRFQFGDDTYTLGINIGLAGYNATLSLSAALNRADSACMAAKSGGRNQYQFYETADSQVQAQVSLQEWAGRIDRTLENDRLFLRAQKVQPIEDKPGVLPYFEILLGVLGDNGEVIAPTPFIAAVENWKRSQDIDLWVVRKVFDWIRANPDSFAGIGGFAINLSALSVVDADVLACLDDALEQAAADIPLHKITFEVTETAAIDSYDTAQGFIRRIRRHGCRFALDDFGVGFSSYSHLKNLRPDTVKIDGSFVKDILNNPADLAMVKSMNEIGHSLGMKTVAEFVETAAILAKLREIGVDYAQGYAIHKTVALNQLFPELR